MAEASVHVARTSGLFKPRLRRGCLPSSVYRLPFTVLPSIGLELVPVPELDPWRSNDSSSHLGTSRWVEARFQRAVVSWKHT
jgi:hypothetical protein